MKYSVLSPFVLAAMMAVISPAIAVAQSAPEMHSPQQEMHAAPTAGPHGGTLRQVGSLQFETLVSQAGIQMFVFDRDGQPLSVEGSRGLTSLRIEGSAKRYRYDLLPDGKGGLAAPANLSQIVGRQIEIDFQLVGLPGSGNRPLNLQEVTTIPAGKQQLAEAAIARQKICPVSGKPLGSMGEPVKVMVGDKPIYLCCKGCVKKVQAQPAEYLARASSGDSPAAGTPRGEEVRPGVFKVSAADAPFIAAQKLCPVMDEPLDSMGGPFQVDADGKAIYICCPGCAKKIVAEPQKYLAALQAQGVQAPAIR